MKPSLEQEQIIPVNINLHLSFVYPTMANSELFSSSGSVPDSDQINEISNLDMVETLRPVPAPQITQVDMETDPWAGKLILTLGK